MSTTFRISDIEFEWQSNDNLAVITYKINERPRIQRIFRGDLESIWLDIGPKYGINETNIQDFLCSNDAKHDIRDEEYLRKYIEHFHRV